MSTCKTAVSNSTLPTTQYPWTQLGYTYDWSPDNPSHIGLSEFMIRKNSKVWIKSITETKEYFTD